MLTPRAGLALPIASLDHSCLCEPSHDSFANLCLDLSLTEVCFFQVNWHPGGSQWSRLFQMKLYGYVTGKCHLRESTGKSSQLSPTWVGPILSMEGLDRTELLTLLIQLLPFFKLSYRMLVGHILAAF